MTVTAIPSWFTVTQASEETGISAARIRKEITEGKLRARRIGRCLRITDQELSRWMLGQSLPTPPLHGGDGDEHQGSGVPTAPAPGAIDGRAS